MKKLLSVLSILTVLVVLASAGIFGYAKYKDVELKQQKLETQLDNKKEESSISENSSNDQEQVDTYTQPQKETEEKEVISLDDEMENEEQKVNRDNVFDYLIDHINSQEGGDASLIKFQEPTYDGSTWTILANNKSGVGSYVFTVFDDGTVVSD